jgi:hypothetical protein
VRRPLLEWALVVGALWLFGGTTGLVLAAAFVVYDLLRSPAPRDLLVLAILLLAMVPLSVLANGLPPANAIGPGFVQGNLVAHDLARAALALLVIGVLREVRAEAAGMGERDGDGRAPATPGALPAPERHEALPAPEEEREP